MGIYNYLGPRCPSYKKPKNVEDCLPQARLLAAKEHGRAAMGPVTRGEKILIVTMPDQDEYVKSALIQALEEKGAEVVDFVSEPQLSGKKLETRSVEDGWREGDDMLHGDTGTEEMPNLEEIALPSSRDEDK